jgi:hypothetical protein
MPVLSFDFTWYRDPKGYRLIPAKPLALRKGQSIRDASPDDIQPARIVRNGGALQSYKPLVDEFLSSRVVEEFMAAASEQGMLKFVEKFGPLTRDGLRGKGEIVSALIDQAKDMEEVIHGRIIATPLNKLNAAIISDSNRLRLKVSPANLLDALWLQLAQSSRNSFRRCLQCGKSFVIGSGLRRTDAKFCSDDCRIAFNSLRRSKIDREDRP